MDAFDYTTDGVTMHAHSCMTPWRAGDKGGPADMSKLITLQNTSKHVTK